MSVGYRNPPEGSQFKKGQSGNSKGRPRQAARPVSTAYLFRKVAIEPVAIEVDGGTVVMTDPKMRSGYCQGGRVRTAGV
jgi:hypothetical protein